MRTMMLLALAACASDDPMPKEPTSVCGNGQLEEHEVCDDGNRFSGDGCDDQCNQESSGIVHWRFFPMLGGASVSCGPGVKTMEIFADNGAVSTVPCGQGSAQVILGFVGTFRVYASALDADGAIVMQSVPKYWWASDPIAVDFYADAGFIRAFVSPTGHPCNITVPYFLDVTSASGTISKKFFCENVRDVEEGVLVSDPLPPGTYDVTVTTPGGQAMRGGVVVDANNGITDLDFAEL